MPQKNQNKKVSSASRGVIQDESTPLLPVENREDSPITNTHIPVLLDEVLLYLNPKKGESYLDLTAGYGGHAEKILERTLDHHAAVLIDRDQQSISFLQDKFRSDLPTIIKSDFWQGSRELHSKGKRYDIILADLGVSSPHLDMASRGFSLLADGPLDMRMDQTQPVTAEAIVNNYSEEQLVSILREYGQEPKARSIARLIIANRPISTTHQLASVVARAWSGPALRSKSRKHPAIRTFQAIRIAVNEELEQIKNTLPILFDMLTPGGRIALISFHSLEDRIIKQAIRELAGNRYDAVLADLTNGPVSASANEIALNPRARSAKLRAAAKIKTKEGA